MTYQADQKPTTLAELVVYADTVFHDSGFHAVLHGWMLATGDELPAHVVNDVGQYSRDKLVKWARKQVRD